MAKAKQKIDHKKKYDWPALKLEYFRSDLAEVKAFFERKFGLYNGNISLKTNGWPAEKEEWKTKATEMVLIAFQKKRAERLGIVLDDISMLIEDGVKRMAEKGNIDADSLKKFHEMVRTELGLPSRIIHQKIEDVPVAKQAKVGLLDKLKEKFNGSRPAKSTG